MSRLSFLILNIWGICWVHVGDISLYLTNHVKLLKICLELISEELHSTSVLTWFIRPRQNENVCLTHKSKETFLIQTQTSLFSERISSKKSSLHEDWFGSDSEPWRDWDQEQSRTSSRVPGQDWEHWSLLSVSDSGVWEPWEASQVTEPTFLHCSAGSLRVLLQL